MWLFKKVEIKAYESLIAQRDRLWDENEHLKEELGRFRDGIKENELVLEGIREIANAAMEGRIEFLTDPETNQMRMRTVN